MSALEIDPNNQGQVNGYVIRALEDIQLTQAKQDNRLMILESGQASINLKLASKAEAAQHSANEKLSKRTGVLLTLGTLIGSIVAGFLGGRTSG